MIGAVATREAKRGVKCVLEKPANRTLAKKWKQFSNFADTDRAEIDRYAAITVTLSALVRIEGGAKIGTAHSQR